MAVDGDEKLPELLVKRELQTALGGKAEGGRWRREERRVFKWFYKHFAAEVCEYVLSLPALIHARVLARFHATRISQRTICNKQSRHKFRNFIN
ncbi:hypothetical protein ACLOJK_011826 [Asimina triloba]